MQWPTEMCQAIFWELKDVFLLKFGETHRAVDWPTFLGSVECRPDAFLVRQIRWLAPWSGGVKLNIDGCSKGNPGVSGGEGILRDSISSMVFAFSGYFGRCTSLQAEAKALFLGL